VRLTLSRPRGAGRPFPRWLAGAALIVLQAPLLLVAARSLSPWRTGDTPRYLELAENLSTGRGFGTVRDGVYQPEAYRLPGYPLFIATARALGGGGLAPVVTAQAILYVGTLLALWWQVSAAFGTRAGWSFAALTSVYPFVAASAFQVSPEIPAFCLVTLAVCTLRPHSFWRSCLAGLLLGAAAMFRANLVLLGPFLAAGMLVLFRRARVNAGALAAAAAVVLAPYMIRNVVLFHTLSPVPVVTSSGISLYLATWQQALPEDALIAFGMKGRVSPELIESGFLADVQRFNGEIGVAPDTPFVSPSSYVRTATMRRADEAFMRAALGRIRSRPGPYLQHVVVNPLRMWVTVHSPRWLPRWAQLAVIGLGVGLVLSAFIGIGLALARETERAAELARLAAVTVMYFVLTLSWLHTEARYTIPARGVLLMFASYLVASLTLRRKPLGRTTPDTPAAHEGGRAK
jgi:hypothetical protein